MLISNPEQTKERFMRNVSPEPNTGCWLWTGSLQKGYGAFCVDGKLNRAHRVSYVLFVGPLHKWTGYHDVCVCHKCDVPACVNPEHLFLGTQKANQRDKENKGRGIHPLTDGNKLKTHCPAGHPYDDKNTGHSPTCRYCRTCKRLKRRIRLKKIKEMRTKKAAEKEPCST